MIHTYKVHGDINADPGKFFSLAGGKTRGHPFKLQKVPATTRVRRLAFASHIVKDWNGLPTEVVCVPPLNTFKAGLDAH